MHTTTNRSIIRTTALSSLAGATGLLLWWFMMPIFLPVSEAATHFESMIQDPHWTAVNLIGLVSTLLVTLGFPMFLLQSGPAPDMTGRIGLMAAFSGLILFTGIQYYETILWPAVADTHPELVSITGVLVKGNPGVLSGLLVSGFLLGAGYLLFGISFLRRNTLPRAPLWMLLPGALLFANGILFPVRTAGLLLFCSGTIWLAIHLKNQTKTNTNEN